MVGAIEANGRRGIMAFWNRQKPEPGRLEIDGLVTPSGDIIPMVKTPRGEDFYHYCDEVGIYRTLVEGKIIPCPPDGFARSIALCGWRLMKQDEPRYGEAVNLLRKAAWQ
jgi:hypothetical protein